MKIKNIVILMFMIITVGLFPAKNNNRHRVSKRNLRWRKSEKVKKYTRKEFVRDITIIDSGIRREVYNLRCIIMGQNYKNYKKHKKIKKYK